MDPHHRDAPRGGARKGGLRGTEASWWSAPRRMQAEGSPSGAKTRKGGEGGGLQIVTRLSPELAARLDRYTDRLRNERFGLRVGRADAVRILIHERLAELEAASSSPATISHKGKTYRRTGKFGADRVSGNSSAEYEGDDKTRVWRDTAGAVREE
jgi:hypothetical protein